MPSVAESMPSVAESIPSVDATVVEPPSESEKPLDPSDGPGGQEANTSSGSPHGAFPEGGWVGWLTVIGGTMVLFSTFGAIQSFGVFQDYYTRVSLDNKTASDVSWIGSFQVFLLFAMGLFSGKMFDEGHFHVLMLAGSFIYLLSTFMISLTQPHHYYQTFLCQGVGVGLGMGLLFLPSLSVSSHYFRARRSLAMGVIFSGSSIGGVVYPLMLNKLFYGRAGFAWGVRAAAFVMTGLLLAANLIMKTRLPTQKTRPKPNIGKIMTDIPYWICVFGGFLIFWGLFFPIFYLQLFAVLHGVPQDLAFHSITIMNAASLLGRTIPNFIADLYGPFNVIIPMSFVSGALIFAMFGAGSQGGTIVFALLYGFFSGGFLSLIAPTLASFSTNVNEVGSRIGIATFVMAFALLTGTPIDGALLQPPAYSWFRPIVFSGVVVLSGTGFLALSRFLVTKKRGTWRV
ncbi:MFS general substrate transporter [Gautieria morchelliformis]|nr:MFS general substrate transporter [Gautieria morchelliformis]